MASNDRKLNPYRQLVISNLRELYREPGILFWVFGFPVLMAWILGVAFSSQEQLRFPVVFVQAQQPQTYVDWTKSTSGPFKFMPAANVDEAKKMISGGQAGIFVGPPQAGRLMVWYDPQSREGASLFLLIQETWRKHLDPNYQAPVKEVYLKEKGKRYIDFLIPGLIALGVLNSSVWGIGWMLIQYRMKKLLRRMAATPMRRTDFLLSHFTVRLIVAVWEFTVLYLFGYLLFDVSLSGSWLALVVLLCAGNFAFAGLAVLLSIRASNTQTANGLINAATLPMTILCGIFFSYQNFPEWLVAAVKVLPLTVLVDALRAIFSQSAGLPEIAVPATILTLFGLATFIPGLWLYKWS